MSAGVTVPEAIVTLRCRLAALPARHPERQPLMASTAKLYDISRATLYRLLRGEQRPKGRTPRRSRPVAHHACPRDRMVVQQYFTMANGTGTELI